ncbi:MAG: GEVED domain-containing protein, partial [Mariniphaga sp.]
MKKILPLLQTLAFVMMFNGLYAQYCIPVYTTGCEFGDGLTQVQLNTLYKPIPCSDIPNYYHDFTSFTTDLSKNGYYLITGHSNNTNFNVSVWIDYNGNSTFEGGEELIGSYSFNNPAGDFTIPFTVPATVANGAKRLRIMSSTSSIITDPCSVTGPGNSCDFSVNIVDAVTPATVITQGATGITFSNAALHGTINAHNSPVIVEFHYGLTSSYGYTITAVPGSVSGNLTTDVSASLTGLLPGSTYHVEVVAYGAGGYIAGGDVTFTTDPLPPPTVVTQSTTNITGTSATLNGTVNANNSNSTIFFEYGIDGSYGRTIAGTPSSVATGAAEPITAAITGLTLNTLYHYRIVSSNYAGTSYGNDMTFTTLATPYCIPSFYYGCDIYNMGMTYFELNSVS